MGSKEHPRDFGVSTGPMASQFSSQPAHRARRFALRFPVYFRKLDSPTWLEGTTENISYTGMLFHSSSLLAPQTALELRLRIEVGTKGKDPTEVRCKGRVVRVEQRNAPEPPVALAVAIRDYRIVRRHLLIESPAGNA
jgi:hypothetical protein